MLHQNKCFQTFILISITSDAYKKSMLAKTFRESIMTKLGIPERCLWDKHFFNTFVKDMLVTGIVEEKEVTTYTANMKHKE